MLATSTWHANLTRTLSMKIGRESHTRSQRSNLPDFRGCIPFQDESDGPAPLMALPPRKKYILPLEPLRAKDLRCMACVIANGSLDGSRPASPANSDGSPQQTQRTDAWMARGQPAQRTQQTQRTDPWTARGRPAQRAQRTQQTQRTDPWMALRAQRTQQTQRTDPWTARGRAAQLRSAQRTQQTQRTARGRPAQRPAERLANPAPQTHRTDPWTARGRPARAQQTQQTQRTDPWTACGRPAEPSRLSERISGQLAGPPSAPSEPSRLSERIPGRLVAGLVSAPSEPSELSRLSERIPERLLDIEELSTYRHSNFQRLFDGNFLIILEALSSYPKPMSNSLQVSITQGSPPLACAARGRHPSLMQSSVRNCALNQQGTAVHNANKSPEARQCTTNTLGCWAHTTRRVFKHARVR